MVYLGAFQIRKALLSCLILTVLPACGGIGSKFGPEQDPKIAALQRETRRVSRANAATQDAIKDLYQQLDALEARLADLNDRVDDLADREPILITPDGKPPAKADTDSEPEKSPGEATDPQPAAEQPATKPDAPPKKQTVVEKRDPATEKASEARASVDQSAESEYQRAYAAYKDGRYDEAMALLKAFLKTYPAHDLSDNAQYWIGEIYYDIDNFPDAILAFKEVATRYPQGNKAPHALLKIGYAYSALGDPANAGVFLKRVVKNYPFSEAEAMARQKLKELEDTAR